jgi:WhiB family transcriptional regulator, redox-sensing transcriptional regulator
MTARPEQWLDLPQLAPLTFDVTRANCRGLDPQMFHPDRGTAAKAHTIQTALAVCAGCEVLEPCREYAIANRVAGIWGGTTGRDRRALAAGLPIPPPRRYRQPQPINHGTESGYTVHRRRNEEPCADCYAAHATYKRQRTARNRGAA